ncbi:MAG: lysylphosphatidylglycerol synthase transmembrane domain-containing protein [Bacteroidales bacterium]|nr:lysylphosphatidylglycerol synthase transmembrane domain-containing protein [Bacteroidales bacterium]
MKDKIKQVIKPGLFIGLSVLLLFLAFRKVDLSEVLTILKQAEYLWVLPALLAATLAYFVRARRWILMIRPLGYDPPFKSVYHALMTGYLFNLALPRLGELTRCVALGKKEKIPVYSLFGTVIAERAFDLISMLIIMFAMVLGRGSTMDSFLKKNIFQPVSDKFISIFDASLVLIIILVIFLAVMFLMIYIYREKLKKVKLLSKAGDLMKGIVTGLKTFVRMKDKIEFIIHTLILWSLYIIMTWLVLYAIPSTSQLNFSDAVFLLVIGTLGMAAPVQGGIGAFHWIISRGLSVVYDINLTEGLAYATVSHESQLLLIAFLGTISFFIIMGKSGKKKLNLNLSTDGEE